MPKVFKIKGYQFYFVSFDGSEPVHIHVRKDGKEAKIWMKSESVAWSMFSIHETAEILKIAKSNKETIYDAWKKHFE